MLFGAGETIYLFRPGFLLLNMIDCFFQIMLYMAANFSYCVLSIFAFYRQFLVNIDEAMPVFITHSIWSLYYSLWIIIVIVTASISTREVA